MRSKTLTLLVLALLASVSLSYTPAANVNCKAKTRRPASEGGSTRRRAGPNFPNAAPTPHTPNGNTSFWEDPQ